MQIEIRLDEIAGICVWKESRGVMVEDLGITSDLRTRIENWIELHAEISSLSPDDVQIQSRWLDYDELGRAITRELLPYFAPNATVEYYSEASESYEPIAHCREAHMALCRAKRRRCEAPNSGNE